MAILSARDIETSLEYISCGSGGLRVATVRLIDRATTVTHPPNLKSSMSQSEVFYGIYWLAINMQTDLAEAVLFLPLYLEKFEKLVRKWNSSDSKLKFELDISTVGVERAVSFYQAATHTSPELLQAALNSLRRESR